MLNLSKCQKSLEGRDQLVRVPDCVQELLGFWKESHHKEKITQQFLGQLIKSIQMETVKSVMVSGGILSKLRAGLMDTLPILEQHIEYFIAMSERKSKKTTEATNAVECVTENIGEREKITIVEIGSEECQCEDLKKIVNLLLTKDFYEPINISTVLPVNRKKRYKVLNIYLRRQTPVKLGLWAFDNHGTAPQSIFAFLVNLEDNVTDIMKHVMSLRVELLKQQKIYYPIEFRQQMKHYSLSIVNLSTAPMKMLMSMILGDDRASTAGAARKLVGERALDAILSGDDDLAYDLRAFNGRETKYVSFLEVIRRTVQQFLAEAKNRWQESYDGTVVSNLSMACSLPALFQLCIKNAQKEDPSMPIPSSEKFICRYLYPRTAAAAAAVSSSETLIALRWALQQKILEKPNSDSYYNMSQYKSLKSFAVALGNDIVTMVATDDKAGIDVGEPGLPIVACQHPGKSWIPSQLRLGEGQHSFHKFNLTPSVRLVHELPLQVEGSFYRGKPQLTLKDAVFEPSSGARHFTELSKSLDVNTQDKKPVMIITNDGGPDHNIHHERNKAALLAFFLNNNHILFLANFQIAANRSAFHPVEKLNCIINLALNGVALERDELGDPNFEKILKNCSSMLDIRKTAAENQGLVNEVAESLKVSKEIIEKRVRLASLKENKFEVFTSATKAEIESFMDILKTVDPDFNTDEYLDTKKKFHMTGLLRDYYDEVSTDCYYCITLMRHRNMSADFLNTLYPTLNLPFDLHPIPCPVKDKEDPEKYLKFEQLYFGNNRNYSDHERPGRFEKKTHNIPFPKSIVRALYCNDIHMVCAGCGKRRVVYSQYKPTFANVEHAKILLEGMRYECGSSLCSFGTEGIAAVTEFGEAAQEPILGENSIFNRFFMDESLSCTSPMEKHLYDIIPENVQSSHPCYYCGETDVARVSVGSEQEYPLCNYCRTVKKFGPVLKRKKRTIVPKNRKGKNRRVNEASNFIERSSEAESDQDKQNCSENSREDKSKSDDGNGSDDSQAIPSLPASPRRNSSMEYGNYRAGNVCSTDDDNTDEENNFQSLAFQQKDSIDDLLDGTDSEDEDEGTDNNEESDSHEEDYIDF